MAPQFSFVIPVFQSAENLIALINRLNELSTSTEHPDFDVVFIDDASTDDSLSQLVQLEKKFPFQIYSFQQNQGQWTASAYGLGKVNTDIAITIDDDLQHDPFEAIKLIKKYEQNKSPLIYGSYEKREHPTMRKWGANLLNKILMLSGADYNGVSSFRLIDRSILKNFIDLNRKVVFLDFELRQMATKQDFIEVKHYARQRTKSSYSSIKLIKLSFTLLLVHTGAPLLWISRIGLAIAFVCFGFGIYYLFQKIYYDVQLGYTSIIVSTLFSSGLILFSLGIIGEYIRRIWLQGANIKSIYARKIDVNEHTL